MADPLVDIPVLRLPALPEWLVPAVDELMAIAERTFTSGMGSSKKTWVKETLRALARAIDVPVLPEVIERPLEDLVIEMVIETIWAIRWKKRRAQG